MEGGGGGGEVAVICAYLTHTCFLYNKQTQKCIMVISNCKVADSKLGGW